MAIDAGAPARFVITSALAACAAAVGLAGAQTAHADQVGYLVNVTVRPGYNFANADAALAYGYGLCDRIRSGASYGQLVDSIESDFSTDDEFQASYLIGQAADQLCPALIWQVRQSAAGYVATAQ